MTKFQYYLARLDLLVIQFVNAQFCFICIPWATIRYKYIKLLLNMAATITDRNDKYSVKLWCDIMRVVMKQLDKEIKLKK